MSVKYVRKLVPQTVKLYFQCQSCGKLWEWPLNKCRKYCNRVCQNAYYYNMHKESGGIGGN